MRLISRVTLALGLSHPLTPLHEGVAQLSHPLTPLREGVASLSRCAHAWEIIHSARSGGEAVRISSSTHPTARRLGFSTGVFPV